MGRGQPMPPFHAQKPPMENTSPYQSWCMNCCSTFHPDMLTGYCISSHCDRCGRPADLAMVKVGDSYVKRYSAKRTDNPRLAGE